MDLKDYTCRFSVIVPVYKAENYIDDCIRSVMSQTVSDFELLLVDDGSPDSSGAICDRWSQTDSRIRVFHKENAGALSARQYGLERARGEYCVFLDSDDFLELHALEVMECTITKYHCDCVIFGLQRVRDGRVLSVTADSETLVVSDKRQLYMKLFSTMAYNPVCRKVMKRSLMLHQDYRDYFHVTYGEDLLQSLEPMRRSKTVVFIPDVLYNYRFNPASATNTMNVDNYVLDFVVRENVLRFLRQEDVFTAEDYAQYRGVCTDMLMRSILKICGFHAEMAKKKSKLNYIRASEYYREFILAGKIKWNKNKRNKILFTLFRWKWDGVLIPAVMTYRAFVLRFVPSKRKKIFESV